MTILKVLALEGHILTMQSSGLQYHQSTRHLSTNMASRSPPKYTYIAYHAEQPKILPIGRKYRVNFETHKSTREEGFLTSRLPVNADELLSLRVVEDLEGWGGLHPTTTAQLENLWRLKSIQPTSNMDVTVDFLGQIFYQDSGAQQKRYRPGQNIVIVKMPMLERRRKPY